MSWGQLFDGVGGSPDGELWGTRAVGLVNTFMGMFVFGLVCAFVEDAINAKLESPRCSSVTFRSATMPCQLLCVKFWTHALRVCWDWPSWMTSSLRTTWCPWPWDRWPRNRISTVFLSKSSVLRAPRCTSKISGYTL